MTAKMKRRKFITLLGGAAAAWPLAASAQQRAAQRRIAIFHPAIPATSYRNGWGDCMASVFDRETSSAAFAAMCEVGYLEPSDPRLGGVREGCRFVSEGR